MKLSIDFPEMIAKFQPEGRPITDHTENDVLDVGKAPAEGEEDPDRIKAGTRATTLKPGAVLFHHADSFPRAGVGCISRIYASLAGGDIEGRGFHFGRKLPGLSLHERQSLTSAALVAEAVGDLKGLELSQ